MNDLTIPELIEGTTDLLTSRAAALSHLPAGTYFLRELAAKRDQLAAAPGEIRALPLAELLKLLDQDHDAWGRAIHYLMLAIESCPDVSDVAKGAAALVRRDYMKGLGETRVPYAVEANTARTRVVSLAEDRAALAGVPTPDGKHLSDWVERYAQAGEKIGDALSGRANALAAPGDVERVRAATLRTELIGLYGELRGAIGLELKSRADAPRTLEDDVLGLLDELQRLASQRKPKKPTKKEGEA